MPCLRCILRLMRKAFLPLLQGRALPIPTPQCRSLAATTARQPTAVRLPSETPAPQNWTCFSSWPPGATVNPDQTQAHRLQREKLHVPSLVQQTACAPLYDLVSTSRGVIWERCTQTSAVAPLCVDKKLAGVSPRL